MTQLLLLRFDLFNDPSKPIRFPYPSKLWCFLKIMNIINFEDSTERFMLRKLEKILTEFFNSDYLSFKKDFEKNYIQWLKTIIREECLIAYRENRHGAVFFDQIWSSLNPHRKRNYSQWQID